MPKYKLSIEGVESGHRMLVEKATEFYLKKLKAHFPFQCNTKNWLKIPNQNVASGPIKNMQSWEAGEVDSVLSGMSPKCSCAGICEVWKGNLCFLIIHGVHGDVSECGCERTRVIKN